MRPGHEHNPVEHHGKREIGHRPGSDNNAAPAYTLRIECAMQLSRVDGCLALIKHLDIAPKRKRTDRPLSPVFAQSTLPENFAKADRETQDLDTTPACSEVMP